ncbi:MAG: hypothetical protein PHE78_04360 [Candidatus Gastranaerophilales bacterium]|nr:hypothetical protein [Candidatus Gastranaerophilales bacterium]
MKKMAHTINKRLYSESKRKYINCEVLVLDEEELLPNTDRREIILFCADDGYLYDEPSDDLEIEGYPETELIDQYKNFDEKS